jgi:hypothetical protein
LAPRPPAAAEKGGNGEKWAEMGENGEKLCQNGFFVIFYGFFTKTTARPPLRSDELWVSPFSRSGGRGKSNDQAAQGFSKN